MLNYLFQFTSSSKSVPFIGAAIMKPKAFLKTCGAAIVALLLGGCVGWQTSNHRANNLFKYLYADRPNHLDTPAIPVLSLPLKVGVAFVPVDRQGNGNGYVYDDTEFSEAQKTALLNEVAGHFKKYPFVKSIEIIPTAYLTPRAGFANLDQLRAMYGVDVMALMSYDQVQFTGEGLLSLTYWTIVGAYVVPAEKNDTRTLLDAAVFDIASRKLLFRAPGVSQVKGGSTLIYRDEQLREDSERGFKEAATNLVTNLTVQLEDFRQRVTNSPTEYKIVRKPGYIGAGAYGGIETIFVGAVGISFLWIHLRLNGRKR